MLLFILIPLAWLTVLVLLVAICRAARIGDRHGLGAGEPPAISIGPKLVLAGGARETTRPRRRPHAQPALGPRGRARRPRAAHAGR
jgi:hypothetical protein